MCPKFINYNSIRFKHVPYLGMDTHPDTGIAFYVNNGQGGAVGLKVYQNGQKVLVNATGVKYGHEYAHGKAEYLKFTHAWGHHKRIYASHAVYIAWREKTVPKDMTIDHIDGNTLNNDFRNLRCISNAENNRDGGFLNKLRNKGIDPTRIQRPILLRYYARMAKFKATHSEWYYRILSKQDLTFMLYENEQFIKSRFENGAHPSKKSPINNAR